MTFYEKDGKNLIVLLHIPTEFAHKFKDVYYSLDKDLIINV